MGMYDTVLVKCPSCKKKHEFQSKSGECFLGVYTLKNCPDSVMENINRHAPVTCECRTLFKVNIKKRKPKIIKP